MLQNTKSVAVTIAIDATAAEAAGAVAGAGGGGGAVAVVTHPETRRPDPGQKLYKPNLDKLQLRWEGAVLQKHFHHLSS